MKRGFNYAGHLLLSYTWGEGAGKESEVTIELTPKGDHVLLVLTHRRLGDDSVILISVDAGGHTHLQILIHKLDETEHQGFWKLHNRMEKEYEKILEKN